MLSDAMKKYVRKIQKLAISSKFANNDKLGGKTIVDFWQWAYSDLLQNTTRGVLAEYIVAVLLGLDEKPRNPWTSYDLKLANGKTVEVKTMSRLQAWAQKTLTVPRVVISPKRRWDPEIGVMEKTPSFNADYYVICYFKTEEHSAVNCLDFNQWEFYVLSRQKLETILSQGKSISLKTLQRLNVTPVKAEELKKELQQNS
jgi:hypothetical protein